MASRIKEDHKRFRDVVSGRTRQQLKKLIKSGAIVRQRPKGGQVSIAIPQIDIPHFVFGDNGEGLGRGPGKEGDIVGRDPNGTGQGSGAGTDPGEGINIQIDMDEVYKFMEEDLELPEMKPKPSETFDEIKIRYNDISKTGPESLRHTRRTMKEALKRLASVDKLDQLQKVPSSQVPIRVISPINSDRRYRQYSEIRIPSSNAVILFGRDCSGSMSDYHCDIVSDMSFWIDCWIRRYYEKVDRCYFVHDTEAKEVSEKDFYTYRYGGGTLCSSLFETVAQQLENRFPPVKYNVYVFYFTDGDNWDEDNAKLIEVIKKKLPAATVNMIGITQICSYNYENTVKSNIDEALAENELPSDQIRTAYIGSDAKGEGGGWGAIQMSEEDRNMQIIEAIKTILAPQKK